MIDLSKMTPEKAKERLTILEHNYNFHTIELEKISNEAKAIYDFLNPEPAKGQEQQQTKAE